MAGASEDQARAYEGRAEAHDDAGETVKAIEVLERLWRRLAATLKPREHGVASMKFWPFLDELGHAVELALQVA